MYLSKNMTFVEYLQFWFRYATTYLENRIKQTDRNLKKYLRRRRRWYLCYSVSFQQNDTEWKQYKRTRNFTEYLFYKIKLRLKNVHLSLTAMSKWVYVSETREAFFTWPSAEEGSLLWSYFWNHDFFFFWDASAAAAAIRLLADATIYLVCSQLSLLGSKLTSWLNLIQFVIYIYI